MADRHPIYPVFLENAGCRERCAFCSQERSAPGTLLEPSAVRTMLDAMLPARGGGEVAYYGGSFTRLPTPLQDALLTLASDLVAAGRVGGIRVSTRPDALGAEELERLVAGGVTTVEIGCQSFSPEVLAACRRTYGPGCVAQSVNALQGVGMRVGLQLMPGLPEATREEHLWSLNQALQLRPDFLRIYPALVLRGTPLEAAWRRGDYRPWGLSRTIRAGARLLAAAHGAGVPVIRFGLQATPELSGHVVAGPYHPALGQLVKARLWFETLRTLDLRHAERIVVHRADLSDAVGYKRRNLRTLQRCVKVRIVAAERVPRGHVLWRDTLYPVPGLSPVGDQ